MQYAWLQRCSACLSVCMYFGSNSLALVLAATHSQKAERALSGLERVNRTHVPACLGRQLTFVRVLRSPRITVHMLLAGLARLGCHQHPDIHNHRSYFWLAFFTSSLWRKLHSRRLWQYDGIRRGAQRHHLSGAGTGNYK